MLTQYAHKYTGFLLYCGPYLLTGKCKYTKSKSEIYSTSVTFKILPLKICNEEKSLLFASIFKTSTYMWPYSLLPRWQLLYWGFHLGILDKFSI